MAVRYNKLWKILIDKKMKKKDLQEAAHITHYQMMKLAYENLTNIFAQISERKDFIMKLPEDIKTFFITETMYKKIGDCECIYDDKVLNDYLSLLTEIENYKSIEKECDEVAAEIKRLKSISRIDFLNAQKKKD